MESFRSSVLGLINLVPGEMVVYNELDIVRREVAGASRPPFEDEERQAEIFDRYMHEHPVVTHMAETGDLSPRAISDLVPPEEFQQCDLYREFFAGLGLVDQIAVGFPSSPELVIGVAISRASIGFSQRDRAMLALLAPHLGASYLAARARSVVAGALRGPPASSLPGANLIVVDESGLVTALTGEAAVISERHLGLELKPGMDLPVTLRDDIDGRAESLSVRAIPGQVPGASRILILTEEGERVDRPRAGRLGLTERERAVANQLARAQSTDQIAEQLSISPHTVKRHLEKVYAKLEVTNRAEAIVRLLSAD